MSRNMATIEPQSCDPGVQKPHMGIANDPPDRQAEIWTQTQEFRKSENSPKILAMKRDLDLTRALSNQNPRT